MDYDREVQQLEEEIHHHRAAAIIQKRWREYYSSIDEQRKQEGGRNARGAGSSGALRRDDKNGELGDTADTPAAPTEEEERGALLSEYAALLHEREAALQFTFGVQQILARHIAEQRSKRGEGGDSALNGASLPSREADARYWAMLSAYREDRETALRHHDVVMEQLERIRSEQLPVIEETAAREKQLRDYVHSVARKGSYVRSSRPIDDATLEDFLHEEARLSAEARRARVENIQLQCRLNGLRQSTTSKGKRSRTQQHHQGVNLIDFEQLKIENTNLNEKIEERNEELVKVRRKATTAIHTLTHMKEKLEFMKADNGRLKRMVRTVESTLNAARDDLARIKKERDSFNHEITSMHECMPLVSSETLLLDYHKRKGTIKQKREELASLIAQQDALSQWLVKHQPILESLQQKLLPRGVASSAERGSTDSLGMRRKSSTAREAAVGSRGPFGATT